MDNDNRQCNKCGLRPQQPAKPKVCGCKPKRCCKKKDCCNDNEFAFRKVVIPSALGDDVTGQAKPENGNYTNSYVEYEINGAQYMYDSFGVYTKMEGGKGGGVSDFNDLDNRPKYAGAVMTGDTNIPDVSAKQDTLTEAQLAAVNSGIDSTKVGQIETNTTEISGIEDKIPNQATAENQLADKNFVNSSIATNTAYYVSDNGQPFASLADLEAYSGDLTNNDYAFVVGTDQQGNTTYTRYKYNADAQEWAEEYVLNNSSFTADQWAAINSGITSGNVEKLADLANIKSIGANLNLDSNGELSATGTTYTDFVGTDGTADGSAGLVPAPLATDAGKYLKADGTWASIIIPQSGIPTDATFWGASYNAANNSVSGLLTFISGSGLNTTLGASGNNVYLRLAANNRDFFISGYQNSNIANFGNSSISLYKTVHMYSQKITNMGDPTNPQDAATKNYVDSFYPVGTVYSSTSSTAPTFAGGTWTQIGTQTIGSSTIYYYERTA